jgi:hypothetical protein
MSSQNVMGRIRYGENLAGSGGEGAVQRDAAGKPCEGTSDRDPAWRGDGRAGADRALAGDAAIGPSKPKGTSAGSRAASRGTGGAEDANRATEILIRHTADDVHAHALPDLKFDFEGGVSLETRFMKRLGL